MQKFAFLLLFIWVNYSLNAQNGYKDFSQLSNSLKQLASRNSNVAQLKTIGKSVQGKEIWLLTLSKGGKPEEKPAICIVAGIDAFHLAGVESSLQIAENILQNSSKDSVQKILEQKTIYIIPCLNPDAYQQAFAKIKYERNYNASNSDNDRDGKLNEDNFEDLNNDGYITLVRIEDPTGEYKSHKDEPRIMVKADASKGEKGTHILISEGIDNDKDGKWNEDGEGGIILNKNFTFNYPFFTDGAGEYAVSEPENRALLDFLYEAKNVYAVFQFGLVNNLTEPVKFDKAKVMQKIITGWQEKDVKVNEQVSKLYEKAGIKAYPTLATQAGNFSDWAYFHYGRFSFGTPVWALPKDTAKKNATDNEEVRFLRWAEANKINNVFLDWKPINHPDFPNKKAEIGGIVPFAKYNPPFNLLKELAEKHSQFFVEFLWQMPTLQITNVRTENLTGGLTRIVADIHNKGLLPTHSELGEKTRNVDKLKIELITQKNQTIVSGKRREVIRKPLSAGEKMEVSWIVAGSGEVQIQIQCATTGKESVKINLK